MKGMTYFCENFRGMRIVLKPEKSGRDEYGARKVLQKGVYVKFENGRFSTEDPAIIAFMADYIKNNPADGIAVVDNARLEKEQKIAERVREEMDKEDQVEKAKKESKNKNKNTVNAKDFEEDK